MALSSKTGRQVMTGFESGSRNVPATSKTVQRQYYINGPRLGLSHCLFYQSSIFSMCTEFCKNEVKKQININTENKIKNSNLFEFITVKD